MFVVSVISDILWQVGKKNETSGTFLFRQDQIRIELFVFFAVFFSCFFKFLSVCVIIWKMKSLYQQQQQRIQVPFIEFVKQKIIYLHEKVLEYGI